MKQIKYVYLLTIILYATSCGVNETESNYATMFSYGRFSLDNGIFYLLCDDDTKIILTGNIKSSSYLDKRFFVSGSLSDANVEGYTSTMQVEFMHESVIYPLLMIDSLEGMDKYGNDAIYLLNGNDTKYYTVFGKYINFIINYFANEPNRHHFNHIWLTSKDSPAINEATIYITHNAFGDTPKGNSDNMYYSYSSVDLTSLFVKKSGFDKIKLTIIIKDINGKEQKSYCEIDNPLHK